jgi:hypothetical protein
VSVEAKWFVHAQVGGLAPALALLPALSLPVGTSEFSAGSAQATLTGLFDWALRSGPTISLNGGASRILDGSGGDGAWTLNSAAALGVPLRHDWAVSGDVFVADPLASGETAAWSADAAVEFYPTPDTQLDLGVIFSTSDPAKMNSVQLGFSRRWSAGHTSR